MTILAKILNIKELIVIKKINKSKVHKRKRMKNCEYYESIEMWFYKICDLKC